MTELPEIEEAGAALTATGPKDAKAERPASPHNPLVSIAPDGTALEPEGWGDCPDASLLHLDSPEHLVESTSPPAAIPRDPATQPIDGEDLLDRVYKYVGRFVNYPSIAAGKSHTLWIAHTHLMEAWFSTPRLAVLSPEPGSGKSRVLEMTALLVPRPLLSAVSSSAFIMRSIADQESRPTILYDEIDAIFGPKGKGNEDLRAVINAGYRRGVSVGRCYTVNGKVLTEQLPTYAAVAMGGLGDLPDTLMSRSIVIRMRRRAKGEAGEAFQPSRHEADGQTLHDELVTWAASIAHKAASAEPFLPDGVSDRNADVWSPLLTVAELAGGFWPEIARAAAIEFVRGSKEEEELPIGIQLLADIRKCFGDDHAMLTRDLLPRLLADEEAPWGELQGRKINPRKLGQILRPYGIKSRSIRIGNETPKGYRKEDFHDPWRRYLPLPPISATSATAATEVENSQVSETAGVADELPLRPGEICGGEVAVPES